MRIYLLGFIAKKIACGLFILFLLLFQPVSAETYRCANNELIQVRAENDSMMNDICLASDKALHFLDNYQLEPKRVIVIELIDTLINSHGYLAYGSYDRQRDVIRLLSLPAVLNSTESAEMYGQPFDQEHYQGAIAHEIAHAIFHHNAKNVEGQLTNVGQEYLAHSTQLGVLSAERRQQIIHSHDIGPWESGDSISDVYMGLNPTGFAIKSYLHLSRLEQPRKFVKLLLNHNWFYVSVP